MKHHPLLLSFALALAPAACEPGADPTDSDDAGDDAGDDDGAPREPVETVDNGDGTRTTTVDATSEEVWVYFDFEAAAEAKPADPSDSDAWDLGLLRFNVKINGGTSGTGEMGVVVLDGVDFAGLTEAPAQGYVADDAPAGPMPMSPTPGYAFDEWYAYDFAAHVLAPKDRVYVVRTVESNYYKLQLKGYYDDAGTPGVVTFVWAPIDPPA